MWVPLLKSLNSTCFFNPGGGLAPRSGLGTGASKLSFFPMGLLLVFLHGLLLALLSPPAPLNSGPFLAFSYSPIFFSLLLPALSEAAFLLVTLFGSTSHIPGLGSLFSFLKNVSVKHSIFLICIIVLAQRNTV